MTVGVWILDRVQVMTEHNSVLIDSVILAGHIWQPEFDLFLCIVFLCCPSRGNFINSTLDNFDRKPVQWTLDSQLQKCFMTTWFHTCSSGCCFSSTYNKPGEFVFRLIIESAAKRKKVLWTKILFTIPGSVSQEQLLLPPHHMDIHMETANVSSAFSFLVEVLTTIYFFAAGLISVTFTCQSLTRYWSFWNGTWPESSSASRPYSVK